MRLCIVTVATLSLISLPGCLVREPRNTPGDSNPRLVSPAPSPRELPIDPEVPHRVARPEAPALPDHVMSVTGEALESAGLPEETRLRYEANLAAAQRAFAENPTDLDATIWVGRRLAYLGRYLEAIAHYTEAMRAHPASPELYRHRGHRFITIRRFDLAIADLEYATQLVAGQPDRVEADGLPNARNIPTSTLQTNVAYHLGLAHYLSGDFDGAAAAYAHCAALARNPDMLVATVAWQYAALARAGRAEEAKRAVASVNPEWDIIENAAYHSLCLVYRGLYDADALLAAVRNQDDTTRLNRPTTLYGLSNHARVEGDDSKADALCREIVELNAWAAFGSIAAEVDLHREREEAHEQRTDSTRSPAGDEESGRR
ncbi:MAG: tetratricopeptide repeat protein [Planctomycetota bacterium]